MHEHSNNSTSSNHRHHHYSGHRSSRKKFPFFAKRLIEVFFYEIIISFLAVKLIDWHVLPETYSVSIKLIIGCILILLIPTWNSLADYLLGVRRMKVYLKVNILVYLILSGVAVGMAYFDLEPYYTYLFFPYKLLYFAGFDKVFSASVVSLVNFVMVFLMPLVFSERLKHQI